MAGRSKDHVYRTLQTTGFFSEGNEGPVEGSEERCDIDWTSFKRITMAGVL